MLTAISRFLWLFPFTAHAAYLAATLQFFPEQVGPDRGAAVSRSFFMTEWIVIVAFSNALLFYFWKRMPRFSDKMLGVPNREYWLQDAKHRATLVTRLQNLIETVLVLINILFLGVYQWVYQSNVLSPVIRLPILLLIAGFITLPMSLIIVYLIGMIRGLKKPR